MSSLHYPRSAAVFGEGPRADEVAHFESPLTEQRALAQGRAVADLSSLRVLTLSGADRLSWLGSLTTQKLDGLQPGESTESLVLSPTGHIEHWLRIVAGEDVLWLISDLDTDAVIDFLQRMKFMLRVEFTDVSGQYQCVGTVGPPPESMPVTATWDDPWPAIGEGSASYAQIDLGMPTTSPEHPGEEHDFRIQICARDALASWDPMDSGVKVVGRDAWEALRIEAWRPDAAEVDHKSLVGELDVLRTAVHLAKGCYRGQEAVARVHNLGQVPRRLVFLHLDGSGHALPVPGAEVLGEVRGKSRPVGTVTSAALHHELGPVALALVKRTLDPAAPLLVAGDGDEQIAAAQEVIVAPQRENRAGVPQHNRDLDQRSRG